MILVNRDVLPNLYVKLDKVPGVGWLSAEQFASYMKRCYNLDVTIYSEMRPGTFYVSEKDYTWLNLKWR